MLYDLFALQIHQNLLDKATPHLAFRWVVTVVLALLYAVRVYILQVINSFISLGKYCLFTAGYYDYRSVTNYFLLEVFRFH